MHKSVLTFTLGFMAVSAAVGCAESSNTLERNTGPNTSEAMAKVETVSPSVDIQKALPVLETELSSETVTRSADSHTHGDAELAIVLEEERVTVELESPMFNLIGFEHKPESDSQKTRVKLAEMQLGKAESLFVFNPEAGCQVVPDMKAPKLFATSHEGHGPEKEHEHDKVHDDHEHDEHEHDDHGHDDDSHNEGHDEHNGAHKDVLLQYQFQCAAPSSLSNVKVNLFEFFEDMVDIDVTYLGPSTQKQVKMTRNNRQMSLSR